MKFSIYLNRRVFVMINSGLGTTHVVLFCPVYSDIRGRERMTVENTSIDHEIFSTVILSLPLI